MAYDNGTLSATACPNHKPVQHRDGKPPWCKDCEYTNENPPRRKSMVRSRWHTNTSRSLGGGEGP